MARKAVAVKDNRGQISAVYFLDSDNLVSREMTFVREEWDRGVVKWEWDIKISEELGQEWEAIGNEIEDIGDGILYRVFFIKRGQFSRRHANDIIEDYIKVWENTNAEDI